MDPAPAAEPPEEIAPTTPERAPARPAGRRTAALGGALALVSFLATAAIVDRTVAPVMPGLTRKLDKFAANEEAFNVAVVGTSLVYHGLAPARFADEMERLGHHDRAFNFGASHLCLGEALRIEDYILRLRPKNLKTIVFELEIYDDLHDGNRDSTRDVWWHTPSATYDSLVKDFAEDATASARLTDVTSDLKTFARHVISVGRLADTFRVLWDPRVTLSWDELEHDDDGFASYDALSNNRNLKSRHQGFLRQQDAFLRTVEARAGQPAPERHFTAYERAQFDTLVRRAREAGYRPVFLHMPALDETIRIDPNEPGADPRAKVWTVPTLSFNDPGAYPDLFEIESRFDVTHLSKHGAMLFTKYFAREYAKLVYGRGHKRDAGGDRAPR
jgi:hypothetical protein